MKNKKTEFGLCGIIRGYQVKNIAKDLFASCVIPMAISALCIIYHKDINLLLQTLVDVTISILPVMASLILTSFALYLSFLWSEKGTRAQKVPGADELFCKVSSSFAGSILISLVSLVLSLTMKLLYAMNMVAGNLYMINMIVFFILATLLIFSLKASCDVVIDIYSCTKINV